MRKNKFVFLYVLIFLSIIIFLIILFVLPEKNPTINADSNRSKSQTSELLHFPSQPILYYLDVNLSYYSNNNNEASDEYKKSRIRWALSLIENASDRSINFKETDDVNLSHIEIYGMPTYLCNNYTGETDAVVEGFAGPYNYSSETMILNKSFVVFCAPGYFISDDNIQDLSDVNPEVLKNMIKFSWFSDNCKEFPHVEVHEILHALGFDHVYDDSKKIMYPIDFKIQSCEHKEIEDEIKKCLTYIYSDKKTGFCSDALFFPWENVSEDYSDFAWESLPVSYSAKTCIDLQKNNLRSAEKILENYVGFDFLEYTEADYASIKFFCNKTSKEVLLNFETDMWTTSDYFPAAQPEYIFDNETIKQVNIYLFGQERDCGGIELHELLHGLGLRNHYGLWMWNEREVCFSDGTLDSESSDALRALYGLNK